MSEAISVLLTTNSPPISTARLTLRLPHHDDIGQLVALAGDIDVARMTSVIPHPYTEDDAEKFIAKAQAGEDGPIYAIAKGGALIGCTGFTRQDDGSADFGYWIGKPYWGCGFATEAAGAALRAVREARCFSSIRAIVFDDNPASFRVLHKLGFRLVGEDVRGCVARQDPAPCHIFRADCADV